MACQPGLHGYQGACVATCPAGTVPEEDPARLGRDTCVSALSAECTYSAVPQPVVVPNGDLAAPADLGTPWLSPSGTEDFVDWAFEGSWRVKARRAPPRAAFPAKLTELPAADAR